MEITYFYTAFFILIGWSIMLQFKLFKIEKQLTNMSYMQFRMQQYKYLFGNPHPDNEEFSSLIKQFRIAVIAIVAVVIYFVLTVEK